MDRLRHTQIPMLSAVCVTGLSENSGQLFEEGDTILFPHSYKSFFVTKLSFIKFCIEYICYKVVKIVHTLIYYYMN